MGRVSPFPFTCNNNRTNSETMNLSYQFHTYKSGQIELAIFSRSGKRVGFYSSIDKFQMDMMKQAAEALGSHTMVVKH